MEDQQQEQQQNPKNFDHSEVDGFGPEPEKKGGFFGGNMWWLRIIFAIIGILIYILIEVFA